MLKRAVGLLAVAMLVATTIIPASAGFGPKEMPTFDGPAFGPKDLPEPVGPAFGPNEIKPVDGPGL
jgi:hypothetical protein